MRTVIYPLFEGAPNTTGSKSCKTDHSHTRSHEQYGMVDGRTDIAYPEARLILLAALYELMARPSSRYCWHNLDQSNRGSPNRASRFWKNAGAA